MATVEFTVAPWASAICPLNEDGTRRPPTALALMLPLPDQSTFEAAIAEINECLALHETGLRLVRLEVK